MALRTNAEWKTFFTNLGITDDATTAAYATAFVAGYISEVILPQLDQTLLSDIGIASIGHRLLIIKHIKTLNTSNNNSISKSFS